ncbi:hydantoinase/oxoprolinase family protein [Nocardia cyriacigeorgica]|uniref:hydantoinase/oxoprolinase family protein n=1 Tax=Nocardia cyriacigeorgica TaxID=135487 RepID=UPI0018935C93|nr:hydantoinase/oxoprolinase family protein [Nocardia cyriacigeorgica]MBF6098742.1 hydantoinase/oxoprolinase family protein [Nocardia cyriacigeorgica]MBF6161940.1 hydantoinase/oxoprolinase family protein [Nocardia cyriacigeorgica]MBF6200738.1 hydantoinase/oxoprolinase family protein [Nocardia cyriacigeorgica]MBF6317452.1 hydantoinase/oxoprolinase family protein [Nocardia cyriacigeorgica]MBF6531996.1 hydantoinase/oxoprolinase family protein [Nocardia cyriacigeorgica]
MAMRMAVDIGGTFTDVVAYDDVRRTLALGKALSTPADLIAGIFDGVRAAEVPDEELSLVIHGSTVVVNALIERKGARTALVTTRGFRDVYEIGRINRPDAFNMAFTKHRPLIDRSMIFEVDERLAADGSVIEELSIVRVREIARRLAELDVEAVAVVLLHAYRNSDHEVRVGEILRAELPDCYISLSHEISREYREFERTSTVAANAFVGPSVSAYLGRFAERLGPETALAVMQSNGGVSDVAAVKTQCVQMLESGPAGGVVGTIAVCETLGYRQAIAFDMGGTTAKSAVIRDLAMPLASDYFLGGYATGLPIRIPCIDIVEVGTGGGSIAWVDEAAGIHVGPRSAGSDPGPACYGRGGADATITDATVVLGHLSPQGELFGGLQLDGGRAVDAVRAVADRIGVDVITAAAGIIAIGAAAMANSVRAVTTERGLDPRDFALFAYGGNGPLHVSLVARELGIRQVVVPPMPSVFSAVGMLMADLRRDIVQTRVRDLDAAAEAEVDSEFEELESECEKALRSSEVRFGAVRFERAADMRYVGQEHTVTVPIPPGQPGAALRDLFDAAHEQRYSHSAPGQPAQIVSLRVSAVGEMPKPALTEIGTGGPVPPENAVLGDRDVVFTPDGGPTRVPVFDRAGLLAGNRITGPAVIGEASTTTLVRPGDTVTVDAFGNLLMTIGA